MIHTKDKVIGQNACSAVTLGNFDGLHLGHQKLVHAVKAAAEQFALKSVVFSFAPHPVSVIRNREVPSITSSSEKRALLEKIGVDLFVEYPFDEDFAHIEPEYFVHRILCEELKCSVLVVGEDYRFGREQKGDILLLEKMGKELGFTVKIIPHVMVGGEKVSSSSIRNMISQMNFEKAEIFLGRPFAVFGNVVTGKKIGRTINFPTVNIYVAKDKLLPSNGVYCTKTMYGGKMWEGVTNVGFNPTIGNKQKTVETFIFGFEKEIYGEPIEIYFYKWLRNEKKFVSIDALKEQIALDTCSSQEYFNLC